MGTRTARTEKRVRKVNCDAGQQDIHRSNHGSKQGRVVEEKKGRQNNRGKNDQDRVAERKGWRREKCDWLQDKDGRTEIQGTGLCQPQPDAVGHDVHRGQRDHLALSTSP